MIDMNQRLNYGFPLSHVFLRLLVVLAILLIVLGLIVIGIPIYVVVIICICFVPFYVFFGVIQFKKRFLKNRSKLLGKIIEIADLKGSETVLDLGTGSGFLAIGFAKHLRSGKSFGLDKFSIKSDSLKAQISCMIKINFIGNTLKNAKINARLENVEDKCKFIEADLTKPIDFSDESFDVIVSSQFFYCLTNQKRQEVFKEINRVLKKGGKIIFFESSSFMGWYINEVKKFYENIGYKIDIIPFDEFKNCCILYGEK